MNERRPLALLVYQS